MVVANDENEQAVIEVFHVTDGNDHESHEDEMDGEQSDGAVLASRICTFIEMPTWLHKVVVAN